ncbi:Hypothetical_protein [Hexamita inflata]|uniref:Hypothetical_protein n=1 Tax=Hexamita inflata TaxID=28002 RepID=A0AA86R4W1_9EUKA|nr:Hypothetical protein HINF_LOCUS58250 [Hexamita inflata]
MYACVQLTPTFRTQYFLGTQMRTKNHPQVQQFASSGVFNLSQFHLLKFQVLEVSHIIVPCFRGITYTSFMISRFRLIEVFNLRGFNLRGSFLIREVSDL